MLCWDVGMVEAVDIPDWVEKERRGGVIGCIFNVS